MQVVVHKWPSNSAAGLSLTLLMTSLRFALSYSVDDYSIFPP